MSDCNLTRLSSTRRLFLRKTLLGAAAFSMPGAFAELLEGTPRQTEGPFYPDQLPLDTDNDLLRVNDATTPAVGEITHLSGRVLDRRGHPVRNAVVEIWQVDHRGIYLHRGSPARDQYDSGFQGFGRFLTGSKGEYYFRTIKPVPYAPGSFQRTPHIHFSVKRGGNESFTTQCYIKDHPMNEKDGVLREIREERARASVLVDFAPIPDSPARELAATFDIVLDLNAAEG